MAVIHETKYLVFASETIQGRKTKIVHVINKSNTHRLATIEWYGNWRQYCFMPESGLNTVWNIDCLNAVNKVITDLMNQRKIKKPTEYKTNSIINVIE